jgi:hypothetical protein
VEEILFDIVIMKSFRDVFEMKLLSLAGANFSIAPPTEPKANLLAAVHIRRPLVLNCH